LTPDDFEHDEEDREDEPRPVPRELWSVYEEGPFRKCVVCSAPLGDRLHQIEKAFRGTEVIFEMAVCRACAEKFGQEMSEESRAVLREFGRRMAAARVPEGHCRSCSKPPEEIPDHSLAAVCDGEWLIGPMLVICSPCGERLLERLSSKTKGRRQDFLRDNFPGVPADLDLSTLGI
jgi:hypothetical protein